MIEGKIAFLLENELWDKLVNSQLPHDVVKSLNFRDAFYLAYCLLYNKKWDLTLQDYAVEVLFEIKKTYPTEWNKSWEYEAFLGQACNITFKYDERFASYKKAYEMAKDPPPGLLIEVANCCVCPGTPPISYDDALDLVKRAMEVAPYSDAIGLLIQIYSLKGDQINKEYWKNALQNSKEEFVSPSIEPKFLLERYLKENQLF